MVRPFFFSCLLHLYLYRSIDLSITMSFLCWYGIGGFLMLFCFVFFFTESDLSLLLIFQEFSYYYCFALGLPVAVVVVSSVLRRLQLVLLSSLRRMSFFLLFFVFFLLFGGGGEASRYLPGASHSIFISVLTFLLFDIYIYIFVYLSIYQWLPYWSRYQREFGRAGNSHHNLQQQQQYFWGQANDIGFRVCSTCTTRHRRGPRLSLWCPDPQRAYQEAMLASPPLLSPVSQENRSVGPSPLKKTNESWKIHQWLSSTPLCFFSVFFSFSPCLSHRLHPQDPLLVI